MIDTKTCQKDENKDLFMSKKNPECPLYNPLNCKEYYNPKLCAFVRKDRSCLKKKKTRSQNGLDGDQNGEPAAEKP